MQIKGHGFINFNKEYNIARDNFLTASISDSYKDKEGNYKNGYIHVILFDDAMEEAKKILKGEDHLVEYSGFTGSYYNRKPQFVITEIKIKSSKQKPKVDESDLPF